MRALFSLKGLTINHPTLYRSDPIPLDPIDQVFGLLYECHHFYFWFNRTYVITFFFLFGFQETGIFSTEWYLDHIVFLQEKPSRNIWMLPLNSSTYLLLFSQLLSDFVSQQFSVKKDQYYTNYWSARIYRERILKKKKENRRCVDFLTNMKLLWWFFRPPHLYTSK